MPFFSKLLLAALLLTAGEVVLALGLIEKGALVWFLAPLALAAGIATATRLRAGVLSGIAMSMLGLVAAALAGLGLLASVAHYTEHGHLILLDFAISVPSLAAALLFVAGGLLSARWAFRHQRSPRSAAV